MSLRHCLDFVCVIDTVRNLRPLALHGSVSAFFAHRVRKLLHITQNPQQSLNSTYTSTPIPYPHKPHHPTTTARVCNPQPTNHISKTTREGAKRPTLNHTSHPSTTARVCKHPTLEGKNSPGWWAGCGCMV